jgi:hypothetical protein
MATVGLLRRAELLRRQDGRRDDALRQHWPHAGESWGPGHRSTTGAPDRPGDSSLLSTFDASKVPCEAPRNRRERLRRLRRGHMPPIAENAQTRSPKMHSRALSGVGCWHGSQSAGGVLLMVC